MCSSARRHLAAHQFFQTQMGRGLNIQVNLETEAYFLLENSMVNQFCRHTFLSLFSGLNREKAHDDNSLRDNAMEDRMSLVVRKPVFGVSNQVQHKPGCTATEES